MLTGNRYKTIGDKVADSSAPGMLLWTWRVGLCVLVAGVIIGVAAWSLKHLIMEISLFVTRDFNIGGGNWWLIGVSVLAIVVVGWLTRNVVKMPLEQSTDLMRHDIAVGNGQLSGRLSIAPILMSALTLGCGGSAGSEGPIAYSGAAIGSNVARVFGIDRRWLVIFLACGAGAGIAGIFKAPVGGMFYTVEVLGMAMTSTSMVILAAMCLLSGITAWFIGGMVPDMSVTSALDFNAQMLPALLLLGLAGGVYGCYYRFTGLYTRRKIKHINNGLLRNVVSGLVLGLLLFMLPSLYGEGYNVLGLVADGHRHVVTDGAASMIFGSAPTVIFALGGILIVKGIATYATNSGGGVAGDFAPTLFAGGMVGAFMAVSCGGMPVFAGVPAGVLVICGMGSVMASVIGAPLMTIFLVVEMTSQSSLLMPVSVTVVTSLLTAKGLRWLVKKGVV